MAKYSGATGRRIITTTKKKATKPTNVGLKVDAKPKTGSYDKNTNYNNKIQDLLKRSNYDQRELSSLQRARDLKIKGENMGGVENTSTLINKYRNKKQASSFDANVNYDDEIRRLISSGDYTQSDLNRLASARDSKIQFEGRTGVPSTQSLIDKYTKQQKTAFPTFEKYSKPQLDLFEKRVKDKYRPEFERYELNPVQEQYGNRTAATGSFMLGSAPNTYRDLMDTTERGFNEQTESGRQAILDSLIEEYNRRYYENQTSPMFLNELFGT